MKIELDREIEDGYDFDFWLITHGNYDACISFTTLSSEKFGISLTFIPEQERFKLSFITVFINIRRYRWCGAERDGCISEWLQKQR
jgi:hypothetical protein